MLDGIEDIEEARSRKTVSLSVEARRAEREQERNRRLARENDRRAALGLPAIETVEELEDVELPDIQLNEAADIVTDLAELRQLVEAEPARTASVRP